MRNTILTVLKDEITEYIKSTRSPYTSDIAEVRRGIHGHDEVVNKPFVGVAFENDNVDEEIFDTTGTDQIRRMRVYIYCFMSAKFDNYDDLHAIIDDMEYFLKYDFTYKSNTYVKDINAIEGGVSAPTSFFDMYIEILYQVNI